MELSAQIIRKKAESLARKGRGYDPDQVDEFVEQVALAWEDRERRARVVTQQLGDAQQRVEEAERRARESAESGETIQRTLLFAQQKADEAVAEAEERASTRMAQAEEEAVRLESEAREQHQRKLEAAEAEVRSQVDETRNRLLQEIGELEEIRNALQSDIGNLEAHVETQRIRLQETIETLSRLVDDSGQLGRVEPPEVSDAGSIEALEPYPPAVAVPPPPEEPAEVAPAEAAFEAPAADVEEAPSEPAFEPPAPPAPPEPEPSFAAPAAAEPEPAPSVFDGPDLAPPPPPPPPPPPDEDEIDQPFGAPPAPPPPPEEEPAEPGPGPGQGSDDPPPLPSRTSGFGGLSGPAIPEPAPDNQWLADLEQEESRQEDADAQAMREWYERRPSDEQGGAKAADPAQTSVGEHDTTDPADPADPANPARQLWLLLVTAAVVVGLDQLTKWWALAALDDGPIDLFWTLRLNLTFNSGAAFSTAGNLGPIIAVFAVVVVCFIIWTGRAVSGRSVAIALGMVAGGAVGNLCDRVFRSHDGWFGGSVIDWIDVQWWPVFNVADASLVIGGVLLVLLVGVRGEEA